MKKIILLFLLLFISCQENDSKLKQNYTELKKGHKYLSRELRELENKHALCKNPDTLEKKINQELELKMSSLFEFTTSLIISDTLAKSIHYELFTNTITKDLLYNLSLLVNPNHNSPKKINLDGSIKDVIKTTLKYSSHNNTFYLHYLWKKLDKSPQNIKYHFDKNKKSIYSLLKNEYFDESGQLRNLTKALLTSYSEINNNKELLNKLYKRTDSIGVLSDTIYNSITSKKIKKLVSEYNSYNGISYSRWAYSFWVRRHYEGNSEVFYKIINEFYNDMEANFNK